MIDSLDFFRRINSNINLDAEEVTFWNGRVEENLFNAKSVSVEKLAWFIEAIGSLFGCGVNLADLQQFSFQKADGVNYLNDKFMAVYSGGKVVAQSFDLKITEAHNDYCINFYLDRSKTSYKFYDLDIGKYTLPELPQGSQIVTTFGLGVRSDSRIQDIYFSHYDLERVCSFFNLGDLSLTNFDSQFPDINALKVFGVSFDSISLKPIRLKRYLYPQDPEVKHTLYDEVM